MSLLLVREWSESHCYVFIHFYDDVLTCPDPPMSSSVCLLSKIDYNDICFDQSVTSISMDHARHLYLHIIGSGLDYSLTWSSLLSVIVAIS